MNMKNWLKIKTTIGRTAYLCKDKIQSVSESSNNITVVGMDNGEEYYLNLPMEEVLQHIREEAE